MVFQSFDEIEGKKESILIEELSEASFYAANEANFLYLSKILIQALYSRYSMSKAVVKTKENLDVRKLLDLKQRSKFLIRKML